MDSNGKLYIQRNEENKQSAPSPSDPSTRLKRVDVMSDQPLNDMLIIIFFSLSVCFVTSMAIPFSEVGNCLLACLLVELVELTTAGVWNSDSLLKALCGHRGHQNNFIIYRHDPSKNSVTLPEGVKVQSIHVKEAMQQTPCIPAHLDSSKNKAPCLSGVQDPGVAFLSEHEYGTSRIKRADEAASRSTRHAFWRLMNGTSKCGTRLCSAAITSWAKRGLEYCGLWAAAEKNLMSEYGSIHRALCCCVVS